MSKTRYKNQKESNEAIAKAYIENDYTNSQNKLLLVSKANYGEKSSNVCYSSVDDKGMNFYEFNNNAERNSILIERYEWADFSSVTIDHSVTKSVFTFVGHGENRDITIEGKGKEVEQVIRNHSSMEVNVVKRPVWTKVLGYRSQTTWKMFMASTVYTLILLFILNALLPASTHNFITGLSLFLFLLSIIGFLVGLIKPKWVLPKFKVKTRKRILFSYLYLILSCLFIVGIFSDEESTSTPASTQISSSQNSVTVASKKDVADSSKQKVEKNDSDKAVKEEKRQKAEEQAAKQEAERKAQQAASQQATTSSSTSSSGNYKPFENDPSDDQQSNMSCSGQIKGNKNSKIYHVPGGAYYDRTQDNIVWFCSEADAQAAGYRESQR
ncbi:calcium-binding protein [Priestia sp. HNGD-A6]|uniref:sunset domain-containing protein n=1 Tax=Priestia sp. HNGD-A6 TaxID=3092666 RepID=UPI0038921201